MCLDLPEMHTHTHALIDVVHASLAACYESSVQHAACCVFSLSPSSSSSSPSSPSLCIVVCRHCRRRFSVGRPKHRLRWWTLSWQLSRCALSSSQLLSISRSLSSSHICWPVSPRPACFRHFHKQSARRSLTSLMSMYRALSGRIALPQSAPGALNADVLLAAFPSCALFRYFSTRPHLLSGGASASDPSSSLPPQINRENLERAGRFASTPLGQRVTGAAAGHAFGNKTFGNQMAKSWAHRNDGEQASQGQEEGASATGKGAPPPPPGRRGPPPTTPKPATGGIGGLTSGKVSVLGNGGDQRSRWRGGEKVGGICA